MKEKRIGKVNETSSKYVWWAQTVHIFATNLSQNAILRTKNFAARQIIELNFESAPKKFRVVTNWSLTFASNSSETITNINGIFKN